MYTSRVAAITPTAPGAGGGLLRQCGDLSSQYAAAAATRGSEALALAYNQTAASLPPQTLPRQRSRHSLSLLGSPISPCADPLSPAEWVLTYSPLEDFLWWSSVEAAPPSADPTPADKLFPN